MFQPNPDNVNSDNDMNKRSKTNPQNPLPATKSNDSIFTPKPMSNPPGQNRCYANSAIQSLLNVKLVYELLKSGNGFIENIPGISANEQIENNKNKIANIVNYIFPEIVTWKILKKKLSKEKIVERMEEDDLPLEESIKLYEEGMKLSKTCQTDLKEAEGKIKNVGKVFENGGEEGLWIPTYMVKKNPKLKTIEGVLQHPELFPHPEDSSKAAFYGCPAGWNCQITTTQMHIAFGMEKAGFAFIDPGSGGALSGSMGEAYNKESGWFGYYWGPTAILGKYDMTKLDEGVKHKHDTWISEINDLNVASPGKNKYPASTVETYVGSDMLKNKVVMKYLKKRSFNNAMLSKILAW